MVFGKVFAECGTAGEAGFNLNLLDCFVRHEEQIGSMEDAEGVDMLIERSVIIRKPPTQVRAVGTDGHGEIGKREVRVTVQQLGFAFVAESLGDVYALVVRNCCGDSIVNTSGFVFMR